MQQALQRLDGVLHPAHWVALSVRLLLVDTAVKCKAWPLVVEHAGVAAQQMAEVAFPEHPHRGRMLRLVGNAYYAASGARRKREMQAKKAGTECQSEEGALQGSSQELAGKAVAAYEQAVHLMSKAFGDKHAHVVEMQRNIKNCRLMQKL